MNKNTSIGLWFVNDPEKTVVHNWMKHGEKDGKYQYGSLLIKYWWWRREVQV